jgi:hypothetical protein
VAALSLSQLEGIDLQAGWPSQLVPQAAAIEEAESGGNPAAIGPGGSWGTFQIQPQYHQGDTQTTDPLTQAKDALAIYQAAGGFTPWSTYPGAAAPYLAQAEAAMAGQPSSSPPASSASSSPASSDASSLWGALSSSTGVLLGQGVNMGQMALGGLVLAGGIAFMLWQTQAGQRVVATAARAGKRAVKTAAEAAVLA